MAAEAENSVGSFLASDPPLVKGEWIQMWGWYKEAVDHPLPNKGDH